VVKIKVIEWFSIALRINTKLYGIHV